jgi:NAD(P)-dependent dehydrogenase (short-subunit alcohol dehydrogenase family)
MSNRLEGKVAVITGSTSGIGRACAELFAEEGAKVVVNGRRAELGAEVVAGIEAIGGSASFFHGDMSVSADVTGLIDYAVAAYGRVDVLMNNAYSGRNGSILDLTEEEWDQRYAIMLKAPILACKAAVPHMIAQGGGSIINTSSVHGVLAAKGNAPYNTFKAALINLTRQMAIDFGRDNVRVNALCPGRIVTEGKIEMLNANPDEVRRQKYTYLLGRPGTMREAAYAALFLACDESSFVTGHALMVDGGLTARIQDDAAKFVEEQVLDELGISGQ